VVKWLADGDTVGGGGNLFPFGVRRCPYPASGTSSSEGDLRSCLKTGSDSTARNVVTSLFVSVVNGAFEGFFGGVGGEKSVFFCPVSIFFFEFVFFFRIVNNDE